MSAIVVTLPYDTVWQALDWAKGNCPGYITNDVHRYINDDGFEIADVDRIDYFFSNSRDALAFALTWK